MNFNKTILFLLVLLSSPSHSQKYYYGIRTESNTLTFIRKFIFVEVKVYFVRLSIGNLLHKNYLSKSDQIIELIFFEILWLDEEV